MVEQEFMSSAVVAWMAAKTIEFAKMRLTFIPLDETTERLNYWAARLVALLTAIGIHSSFDPSAGTLTITGLTVGGVFSAMLEYARQLLFQEIAYKKFVRKSEVP